MLVTARVLEAGHPVILSDDLLISCLCLRKNGIIQKLDCWPCAGYVKLLEIVTRLLVIN